MEEAGRASAFAPTIPRNPAEGYEDDAIELAKRGGSISRKSMETTPAQAYAQWRAYVRMGKTPRGIGHPGTSGPRIPRRCRILRRKVGSIAERSRRLVSGIPGSRGHKMEEGGKESHLMWPHHPYRGRRGEEGDRSGEERYPPESLNLAGVRTVWGGKEVCRGRIRSVAGNGGEWVGTWR